MKKLYRIGSVLLVVCLLMAGCIGGGGKKEYSVSGVVQDEQGSPIAGVELSFEGSDITSFIVGPTGADGKFTANGLKGTVTLTVLDLKGWVFEPKTTTFTKADSNVVITGYAAEYSIAGIVRDGAGVPLAGVEIALEGEDIGTITLEATGADGKFGVGGLKGKVTLKVLPLEGWRFTPEVMGFTKGDENVVIIATQEQDLNIVIDGEGYVDQEVIYSPLGLSTDYYPRTTQVKLTAIPEFDWRFIGWYGDVPDGWTEENPIIVTMDGSKWIMAVFVPQTTVDATVRMAHSFPFAVEQLVTDAEAAGQGTLPGTTVQSYTEEEWEDAYIDNEFIVMMSTALSTQDRISMLSGAGYEIKDSIDSFGAYLITPKSGMIGALSQKDHLSTLQSLSGTTFAEQNARRFLFGVKYPDDPYYAFDPSNARASQWWHYDQIRLPQAWAVTTGSKSVRVAVIDTGIDPEHVDLQENLNLEDSFDFTEDNDIYDYDGHGTHVAGTIGATTNNGLAVAGVMWDVDLLALKVFDQYGYADSWGIGNALLYAAGLLMDEEGNLLNDDPVDVVNMSLGGPYSEFEDFALEAAAAQGVILVAATGNNGRPVISYPAAHPAVIAVGATASGLHLLGTDYDPPLATYTNYGPLDFVLAPGGGGYDFNVNPVYLDFVASTYPGNRVAWMTGTSMASPHVAGVIGLMLSNGIPKSQVREVLERTCMKINDYNEYYYGYGLVNAYWAVNAVEEIRLIQGIRNGAEIEIAAETRMPLPESQAVLTGLEAGEFQLIAWVDVNKNDLVDAGDYYSETDLLGFDYGQGWSWWPVLTEFDPTESATYSLQSTSDVELITQ